MSARPEPAPSGVELDPGLQPRLDALLQRLAAGAGEQALSDLNFANLYLFRRAHAYRFLDGDWPCIAGRTYDGTRHLIPLFALPDAPLGALRELLRGHDCFYPLRAAQAEALDPAVFACASSRDDADYLYPAENFLHYRGRALHKKRNLMQQLLGAHALQSLPYAPDRLPEARAVLQGWMLDKGRAPGEADEPACLEALAAASRFGLEGFLHRVDGEPAGFVLAQELQPGVFVMRFAKGRDAFHGIAQYMFHHFCSAFERPVRWLNFEQDLGLANFRRTKLSYRPSALLAKLRVRLREPH